MNDRIAVAGRAFVPWFTADQVPDALRGVFAFNGALCQAAFPGLFEANGQLGVILPRAYHALATDSDLVNAAGVTLRLLVRYLRDKDKQDSVVKEELESALVGSGVAPTAIARLEVGLALWEDFARSGSIPVAARTTSPRVRGRTHWPLTIARSQATIGLTGAVYADPVQTRFAIQPDHELTALHEATASEAGAWLGWTPPPRKHLDPDHALALVERHGRSLYQDRQKRVCSWLRAWHGLTRAEGRSRTRNLLGIFAKDFPLVWERMLYVALGSIKIELPRGSYRRMPGGAKETSTRFRPDLILDDRWNGQPVRLVLDAKDYIEGTLPKDEAVRKQILYRLLLSDRTPGGLLPLDRIGNGFLAPALVEEGLRVTGIHDIEGQEGEAAPLGRIVCMDVDFTRVAKAYARGIIDAGLRAKVVGEVMATTSTSASRAPA